MKSKMLLPAVALTICLALPQFSQATILNNEVATAQQKEVAYAEITSDQLPKGVSDALAKDYAGFNTDKAYKGEDGSFKVAVSKGTDKSVLFFSEKGELIKSEKATDKAKSEKMKPENPMK
jgi:hypothetical protein